MGKPLRRPVFLWNATHTDPLFEKRLLFCEVVPEETTVEKKDQDINDIRATFEELPV